MLVVLIGCNQTSSSSVVTDKAQLESQLALSLPDTYNLLLHQEAERQGDDFQEWLLYSSTSFQVLTQNLPDASGKISISIQTVKDLFHSRGVNLTNELVTDAYSFRWQSSSYYYDATILQMEDGEYILIARYPR